MHLTRKLLLMLALMAAVPWAGAEGELRIGNTVRNTEGEPLTGILVHARPQEGNTAPAQRTRTDEQGQFAFTLAEGRWYIEVDPAELLERGYFCVPGWFPPDLEPPLTAVPITPVLDYSIERGKVTVVATFDWLPNLNPSVMRMCAIQRSEDLVKWETFALVGLTDPPVRIEDPNTGVDTCFYRCVDLGSVRLIVDPAPEE